MIDIKDRIKEALETRSMTAAELAKKSGINKGAISKYINGLVIPKQSAIGEMADALRVSPAWLMGYAVPMERESTLPGGEIQTDPLTDGLTPENLARLKSYADYLRTTQNSKE